MPESLYVIPADDDLAWTGWLEPADHDFYHGAAYHRFSAASGEGEPFLAVYGSRDRYLAWPYLLRRLDGLSDLCDLTSVYGYPGPVAFGLQAGDPFVARARRALEDLWRSQNVVTAFTRFHPLLENHRWAGSSAAAGVVPGGETVSIDLSVPETVQWSDYQASLRNRINRGRRLGLRTEPDPCWAHLDDFVAFYHATMRRNRAGARWFFSADYFRRLRRALGANAVLMLTRLDGALAAAGIFIAYRGIVANHFSMNNEAWLHLAPTKILLDDVRRWAGARGERLFHLGGGRSSTEDSLFAFKAAFSRRRHRFYTLRRVLDPPVYRELCAALPAAAGTFFPAYRAALEQPAAAAALA